MDTRRLTEIEERCEKAPRGPWISFPKPKYQEWHVGIPADNSSCNVALSSEGVPGDDMAEKERLATFIAHARTDLPDLLAYCKSLRADVAELASELHDMTQLMRWWAPKDGVKRDETALELLSRPTVVELLKEKD